MSEIVDPSAVLDSEKLEHALVDLLGQLLIGGPDYPAALIRPPLLSLTKLRYIYGHLALQGYRPSCQVAGIWVTGQAARLQGSRCQASCQVAGVRVTGLGARLQGLGLQAELPGAVTSL